MVDIQDRALPQVGLMDMAAVALHRISHGSVVQLLKTDTRLADFGWSEFAKNGYSTSSLIAFVLFTVLTVGFFWVSVAIYAAARKNNGDAPIGALLSSFGDGVPSGCGQSKRAATESLSSTCDPIDSGAVAAKRSSHTSKGAHVSDAANDSAVGGKSTAAAAAKVLTAATNPTASAA
ncbi:MAG: hypothetical protein LBI39_03880, partial [Puniceicoccales bacterium]|nr:hypothetical protein [Puniceicoccales bacterium]